jgi:predicted dehydrogenase
MSKNKFTRRTFLAGSAALAAGCSTVPSKAPGKVSAASPSGKLNVAAIGAGGKGRSDIWHCRGENIVALCDVDIDRALETRAGFEEDARNRGDEVAASRFANLPVYQDYRKMLEKESIDACTISTPDHQHAVAAAMAMKMGKHVYVQKPLTHDVHEARELARIARDMGVATQMGNQGHSGDGVRELVELVDSGVIGPVREAHVWTNRPLWKQGLDRPAGTDPIPKNLDWDLWLGTAPDRPFVSTHPVTEKPAYHPWHWRGWWDFGTGALGDMACHIMDPPNWALRLGVPTSVEVIKVNGYNPETGPTMATVKYEFPERHGMPPVTVYWYEGVNADGTPNQPPRPASVPADQEMGDGGNGTLLIGDDGIATCNTYGSNARLLPDEKMLDWKRPDPTIPRIPRTNPDRDNDYDRRNRLDWLRSCKDGVPSCGNFDYAGPFAEVVLLGVLAIRSCVRLQYDIENARITNCAEANNLIQRRYREGWSL